MPLQGALRERAQRARPRGKGLGALLEIAWAGTTCLEGSNPSLPAEAGKHGPYSNPCASCRIHAGEAAGQRAPLLLLIVPCERDRRHRRRARTGGESERGEPCFPRLGASEWTAVKYRGASKAGLANAAARGATAPGQRSGQARPLLVVPCGRVDHSRLDACFTGPKAGASV